ncbi:unnamed protein product [Spirodela intermedia]|uniref:BTB domain-containing protein n=1 Tax=Spirodela intermedia TaxID=51605 RepID=A0A7I8JUF9_SPIIN|nr:unnamed protein product [Spirodela intermedia]CAA6673253.1 unnamed protein product [Spirodela intermedia]
MHRRLLHYITVRNPSVSLSLRFSCGRRGSASLSSTCQDLSGKSSLQACRQLLSIEPLLYPTVDRFGRLIEALGKGPLSTKLLQTGEEFSCPMNSFFEGKFTIDMEFLDLNLSSVNVLVNLGIFNLALREVDTVSGYISSLLCLSHMLEEDIHSDITMNTAGGTLRAHKAVLTKHPFSISMLLDDHLEEEMSSVIEIEDMSLKACDALLIWIYGTIQLEVFLNNRLGRLTAAEKYDLADLNVLEAWLYLLDCLKKAPHLRPWQDLRCH